MVAHPPPRMLPLGICPVSLRRLASLACPVIGLNVLQVLTLAVDTAMLGRVPDAATALTMTRTQLEQVGRIGSAIALWGPTISRKC